MYPNSFQTLGESRIREWHEQAARDRLIRQARRARREAAHASARRPWRARFRPTEPVSAAPADERAAAVPTARAEEQAAVSTGPVGEQADRQPVGSRAA